MSLKDNLKRFRERAGFKQAKDFAKIAGLPYSSYSSYERGAWPNEENLIKIATTLNVSLDTLIGFKVTSLDTYISYCREAGFVVVNHGDKISINVDNPNPMEKKIYPIEMDSNTFSSVMKLFLEDKNRESYLLFHLHCSLKNFFEGNNGEREIYDRLKDKIIKSNSGLAYIYEFK